MPPHVSKTKHNNEHYTMQMTDFTVNKDDNGNEFITFAEGPASERILQGPRFLFIHDEL